MSENRKQGLTSQQVEENRLKYGANVLTPPARESLWKKFIEKFEDPIIRILLVAWLLSMIISCVHCWGPEQAGFSAFLEPIGIFFAIILASGIGFIFEVKAARAFDVLNTVNDDVMVTVLRDGKVQEVSRKEIVVGDVVILNTGDEVPADKIAELVMDELHKVDEVAYIRFASVYRKFTDVAQFLSAITEIVKK